MSDRGVQLRDGTPIEIRPISGSDKEALAAAFERLSPESRYRRFFRPLKRLTATDLRYLTEVDHRDHEALVAIGPDGDLIGVARYIRSEEDPASAEVAVTVADDWQSRGVATLLLERLVERARAEGIGHFLALVLGENRDAVELFRQLAGNDVRPRAADGTVEFNPLRLLRRLIGDNRPPR